MNGILLMSGVISALAVAGAASAVAAGCDNVDHQPRPKPGRHAQPIDDKRPTAKVKSAGLQRTLKNKVRA